MERRRPDREELSLAHSVGDGVVGVIHDETSEVSDEAERRDALFSPTFVAEGE